MVNLESAIVTFFGLVRDRAATHPTNSSIPQTIRNFSIRVLGFFAAEDDIPPAVEIHSQINQTLYI